jgi:hypothetical protein
MECRIKELRPNLEAQREVVVEGSDESTRSLAQVKRAEVELGLGDRRGN